MPKQQSQPQKARDQKEATAKQGLNIPPSDTKSSAPLGGMFKPCFAVASFWSRAFCGCDCCLGIKFCELRIQPESNQESAKSEIGSPPRSPARSAILHKHFPRQLADEAFHFQTKQGDGYSRTRQTAAPDDFVDVRFLIAQGIIDLLFVLGEVERGEHAGFARARRAVAGGEEVFELA